MFTCEVCAATFTRKDNLNRHFNTHNGVKFTCNICLKSYTRKHDMFRHREIVHTVIVGQPLAITPASPAIAPAPPTATPTLPTIASTSGPWDETVGDDAFLEALNDFENQGKKIHYSMH
jgi:hypothetical protein